MLCYCNIMFPYRIKKAFRNIPINIPSHEMKKLRERFGVCRDVSV